MQDCLIQELDPEKWKGTALPFSYTSEYYYDLSVRRTTDGFTVPIRKQRFASPFTHRPAPWTDRLFEDWWKKARAFGIVEEGKLRAVIELCPEEWSNRLLITELFVSEELRGRGIGGKLIGLAKELTVKNGYRTLILETQSSNVNAVDFYLHEGFTLIGFDSCCYTNRDLERKEVRLDMGWFPDGTDV